MSRMPSTWRATLIQTVALALLALAVVLLKP